MVLFNQARHPQGLYSAVETGMTFFSLPSFIFTFLPPSLAKPGTSAGAGGGRLNVYDAIRSSVIHSRTFRARQGKGPLLGVCGLENSPVSGSCGQTEIVIFVLAGVVDYRADIQTLHPRISWAVVEQTEIGAIPWQRAGQGESRRYDFARDTEPFCIRRNLKLSPG